MKFNSGRCYKIRINRQGELYLSVGGMELADYKRFLSMAGKRRINVELDEHNPMCVVFKSSWDNEYKIQEVMKEMGMEERDPLQ